MKLVVTTSSLVDAKRLINAGADIILVGTNNLSNKMQGYLTKEEIKELKKICEESSVSLYFNANLICHDENIKEYTEFFQFLKEVNIDGIYVSDVALIKLSESFGLKDRIIYNPETLITNSFDANYYLNQGIRAITLSKEITLEDYQKISSKKQGNVEVIGFGHYSMFHTKRSIIKNYFDFRGIDKDFTNQVDVRLREETRNEFYPILEEERSSTIFRTHATNVYDYLEQLTFVSFLRLDGIFKSIELQELVVKSFKDKISNNVVVDLNALLLEKFNETTDTGFLFKKTVYGK